MSADPADHADAAALLRRSGSGRRLLRGWGRTAPTAATVVPLDDGDLVAAVIGGADERGVLARGLGRSYGDAAQNAGGVVVAGTTSVGVVHADLDTGRIRVRAGTSLEQLMEWFVPYGWFVPVTPGTRQVTVGGAIAADVHGKNHHTSGSFCDHVESFRLLTGAGELLEVTPETMPDVFWATAGGMGLTGVLIDATICFKPIETSWLRVDTDRAANLDEVMALMADDASYTYSVAWIDIGATGASLGRSILDRGDFATVDELAGRRPRYEFRGGTLAGTPPLPGGLINHATVTAFNELWFRKAPRRRRGHLQSIGQFFHPLDMVRDWNRVYGPRGFLQWQFVVPMDRGDVVERSLQRLSAARVDTFLAVLKTFGPANGGHLSFPGAGWTLAFDTAAQPGIAALFDELDRDVVDAGGRIYLAKDSRVRPELVGEMYPRLDEWREVAARLDPEHRITSDLDRRLHLRSK